MLLAYCGLCLYYFRKTEPNDGVLLLFMKKKQQPDETYTLNTHTSFINLQTVFSIIYLLCVVYEGLYLS